jgi:hypothetical protein
VNRLSEVLGMSTDVIWQKLYNWAEKYNFIIDGNFIILQEDNVELFSNKFEVTMTSLIDDNEIITCRSCNFLNPKEFIICENCGSDI